MPELKTIFSLDERLPWISGAEYEFFVQVVELSGEQSKEAWACPILRETDSSLRWSAAWGTQLIGRSTRHRSIAALQRP